MFLTPMPLAEKYGADGLRYWSCKSGPGVDTAVDESQMKVGRRLALKMLNATRFVLGLGVTSALSTTDVTEELDQSMLRKLAGVVEEATAAFEGYEGQRALAVVETFFWDFCDDYLELVKSRAYSETPGATSAKAALSVALSAMLRTFAPFVPFATEEAWSWWQDGSVHRGGRRPRPDELADSEGHGALRPYVAPLGARGDQEGQVRGAPFPADAGGVGLMSTIHRSCWTCCSRDGRTCAMPGGCLLEDLVLREAETRTVRVKLAAPEPGRRHGTCLAARRAGWPHQVRRG